MHKILFSIFLSGLFFIWSAQESFAEPKHAIDDATSKSQQYIEKIVDLAITIAGEGVTLFYGIYLDIGAKGAIDAFYNMEADLPDTTGMTDEEKLNAYAKKYDDRLKAQEKRR